MIYDRRVAATRLEQNRITPGVFESASGRERRKSINNNYMRVYLRDLWKRSLSGAAAMTMTTMMVMMIAVQHVIAKNQSIRGKKRTTEKKKKTKKKNDIYNNNKINAVV